MSGKNIIEINGRLYDAISGMPLPRAAHAPQAASAPASQQLNEALAAVGPAPTAPVVQRQPAPHRKPHAAQKSQTLRRDAVVKPTGAHADMVTRTKHQPAHTAQHPAISKFSTHAPLSNKPAMNDVSPMRPPTAPQLRAARQQVVAPSPLITAMEPVSRPATPHAVAAPQTVSHPAVARPAAAPALPSVEKESVLAQAVENSTAHHAGELKAKKRHRAPKIASILAVTVAVALFTGYLTYLTMPGLSMKIAASQAGVAATYPEFQPSGYRFDGPITFASGEVTAQFRSNTDDTAYSIKQRKSPWDSQAVLDNYVAKQSSRYVTLTENGITVYTFDNKAAWVNGGILYTLGGNARLSNDQVMKIATSM